MNFFSQVYLHYIAIPSSYMPLLQPSWRVLTRELRSIRDDHILFTSNEQYLEFDPKWKVCFLRIQVLAPQGSSHTISLASWQGMRTSLQGSWGWLRTQCSLNDSQGEGTGKITSLESGKTTIQKHLAQCLTSGRDSNITASPIQLLCEMWTLLDCPRYCPL